MLRFWESEPQYAFKHYAYKKTCTAKCQERDGQLGYYKYGKICILRILGRICKGNQCIKL